MKLNIIEPNPPITEAKLQEFENKFLKLPLEYKNFLLEHNGGDADGFMFYQTNTEWWGELYIGWFLRLEEIEETLLALDNLDDWEADVKCMEYGTLIIGMVSPSQLSIGIKEDNFGKIYVSNFNEDIGIVAISESFDTFINGFEKQEE